jgi:hypothetical protein
MPLVEKPRFFRFLETSVYQVRQLTNFNEPDVSDHRVHQGLLFSSSIFPAFIPFKRAHQGLLLSSSIFPAFIPFKRARWCPSISLHLAKGGAQKGGDSKEAIRKSHFLQDLGPDITCTRVISALPALAAIQREKPFSLTTLRSCKLFTYLNLRFRHFQGANTLTFQVTRHLDASGTFVPTRDNS